MTIMTVIVIANQPQFSSDIMIITTTTIDDIIISSSLLLLLPALVDLLRTLMGGGNRLRGLLSMVLAVFLITLTVVNLQIVYSGMGVEMGWLAHIFLSLAMTAVITFYLLRPEESSGAKLGQ